MNELRVACEVWSTEVCEVSLTKNLRGKIMDNAAAAAATFTMNLNHSIA